MPALPVPPAACAAASSRRRLPSSTMMARRPSGDSPTHLTLYRVAKGRVLDLLLKDKNHSCVAGLSHEKRRWGWPRTTHALTPPVPGRLWGQSSQLIPSSLLEKRK